MKLLFDENLSPKLVQRLDDLFTSSVHVRDIGLKQSPDVDIWNYAKQQEYIIVTTDDDFRQRALALGPPPQIVFMERCDFPLRVIEELIRGQSIRIREFAASNGALLTLRR